MLSAAMLSKLLPFSFGPTSLTFLAIYTYFLKENDRVSYEFLKSLVVDFLCPRQYFNMKLVEAFPILSTSKNFLSTMGTKQVKIKRPSEIRVSYKPFLVEITCAWKLMFFIVFKSLWATLLLVRLKKHR